jgi:hypothetical protein
MLKYYLTETYKAKEIPSKNKYDMMEGTGKDGRTMYFFLGSNGALRVGSTKAAAKSISYTGMVNFDRLKEHLEQVGLL